MAFEKVIRPAAERAGYQPVRADQLQGGGFVMTDVIRHLADDPLVVADLTGANPNVFYELALRHAMRKPVIALLDERERIPFDIGSFRLLQFDTDDPRSLARASDQLSIEIGLTGSQRSGPTSPFEVALPAWKLCVPAGRVPYELVEMIVAQLLEVQFYLDHTPPVGDANERCARASSAAAALARMLEELARLLGTDGPSGRREYEWRLLSTILRPGKS
jgi:hypothetical protein